MQYKEEREAMQAYAKFNGRFYASRQISCEFVKIEKWKSAICGEFSLKYPASSFIFIFCVDLFNINDSLLSSSTQGTQGEYLSTAYY